MTLFPEPFNTTNILIQQANNNDIEAGKSLLISFADYLRQFALGCSLPSNSTFPDLAAYFEPKIREVAKNPNVNIPRLLNIVKKQGKQPANPRVDYDIAREVEAEVTYNGLSVEQAAMQVSDSFPFGEYGRRPLEYEAIIKLYYKYKSVILAEREIWEETQEERRKLGWSE